MNPLVARQQWSGSQPITETEEIRSDVIASSDLERVGDHPVDDPVREEKASVLEGAGRHHRVVGCPGLDLDLGEGDPEGEHVSQPIRREAVAPPSAAPDKVCHRVGPGDIHLASIDQHRIGMRQHSSPHIEVAASSVGCGTHAR